MLINKAVLAAVFLNLKTEFNNALKTEGPMWDKIAMRITSTSSQNEYKWLDQWPAMRKWVGEKVIKALSAHSYTIVNDDWEATVEVDRNDIEDDNLGLYGTQARASGESARDLPDQIVFDLVNEGFTSKCYDGQNYFDTDHPVVNPATGDPASVSNKLTVALSAATQAAAIASLGAAITMMREFKDDEGRPLDVNPNILLVPPALEIIATLLMTTDRLEDGKPNPYKGRFTVVSSGRLTSPTAWFLLDTKRPIRPFIFQERKKPVFVEQTDMSADDVFNRKKYKFGAEARAAGGYGFWQLAVGSTGQG